MHITDANSPKKDEVKETTCAAICRFIQVITKEKINYLMPLPMDEIMQTLIHYVYEAATCLSETAMTTIMELSETRPLHCRHFEEG